jgi:3-hydroxyacyl-[acyl-carrier-protein] dehydratase
MPIVPLVIPSDHPAFAGHFPSRPIVPGVVLLDLMQRAIESKTGLQLAGLPAVKFLSPAVPGDTLELEYEVAEQVVRFEIRCGVRLITNGRFLITKCAT